MPRIGVKAGIGQACRLYGRLFAAVGCAFSNPGANWNGANSNIETEIKSDNYAGTCSYKMDAGKGQLRFIGGVFHQEVSGFKEQLGRLPIPSSERHRALSILRVTAGAGALALPTKSLISLCAPAWSTIRQVKLDDISGTLDLTQVPGISRQSAFGGTTQSMPDSVEFKLQSGIAPGWLAFGSVKWVNWSVLQSIPILPDGSSSRLASRQVPGCRLTSLDLLYRDGWTVSGGIGHKFNDQWSGAAQIHLGSWHHARPQRPDRYLDRSAVVSPIRRRRISSSVLAARSAC